MPLHAYDTAWREIKSVHAYDGTAWREIKSVHAYDGTAWREVFVAEAPPLIGVGFVTECDPIENHEGRVEITPSYSARYITQRGVGASPGSWTTVDDRTTGAPYLVTDSFLAANTTYTYRVYDNAKGVGTAVSDTGATGSPCP
jgi:hypothetical protein